MKNKRRRDAKIIITNDVSQFGHMTNEELLSEHEKFESETHLNENSGTQIINEMIKTGNFNSDGIPSGCSSFLNGKCKERINSGCSTCCLYCSDVNSRFTCNDYCF